MTTSAVESAYVTTLDNRMTAVRVDVACRESRLRYKTEQDGFKRDSTLSAAISVNKQVYGY